MLPGVNSSGIGGSGDVTGPPTRSLQKAPQAAHPEKEAPLTCVCLIGRQPEWPICRLVYVPSSRRLNWELSRFLMPVKHWPVKRSPFPSALGRFPPFPGPLPPLEIHRSFVKVQRLAGTKATAPQHQVPWHDSSSHRTGVFNPSEG